MLKLTLAAVLLSTAALADDAKPAQQGVPDACQKNPIILSILDSRYMSARDANQVAGELCKQIMAKVAAATPAPTPKH